MGISWSSGDLDDVESPGGDELTKQHTYIHTSAPDDGNV